jgi:succinyl-CoA synthetase beta subunit
VRFYEFETKRLLAKHGIGVPQGGRAATAADAEKLASEAGGPVVVKAQALFGGTAKNAVRAAGNGADAKRAAEELLAATIAGRKPNGVLIEKTVTGAKSFALSFTYDGVKKVPVMMACTGAGNIDDILHSEPRRVVKRHFSALHPLSDYRAKELVAAVGVKGALVPKFTALVAKLSDVFLRYDLTVLDVTNLAQLEDGTFVVVDAFADMEIEGRRRQKAILDELGVLASDPRSPKDPTAFEVEAAVIDKEDPRGVAGPVVEFDGNIGLVIGAGGGSLTTFDAIKKHGGRPANYAALGGNPSVGKAKRLTKLVLSKPGVEKIAVISNVVSNTRADLVARGVIKGVVELGFKPADKITVFRVPGAWEADAMKILSQHGVEFCDRSVSISEAARRAVEKIGR